MWDKKEITGVQIVAKRASGARRHGSHCVGRRKRKKKNKEKGEEEDEEEA